MTLGAALRDAREALGLTLRDVQRRTGINNAHLSQIETGKIERPEVSLLFELAGLYDLDLVSLMQQAGHLTREGSGQDKAITTAALRAVGQLPSHQKAEALNFMRQLARRAVAQPVDVEQEARRRVIAIAERALRSADVAGVTPTPLDEIAKAAGIVEVRETSALPHEIERNKPGRWKKILGAVVFPEKVIYIDRTTTVGRARFTQAHETAHMLLPWHETAFLLDDERRLFYDTAEELEAEANAAAAHLIFQGHRYHELADNSQLSIRVPVALADKHGASMHASIRYFVEQHEQPVAVLVAGRYAQHDGTLPIWQSVESAAFLRQYGRLTDHVPKSGLPVDESDYVLGTLARAAFDQVDPPSETVSLEDIDGASHRFRAEAFFNQYVMFVMVTPKKLLRLGRRTRLATSG